MDAGWLAVLMDDLPAMRKTKDYPSRPLETANLGHSRTFMHASSYHIRGDAIAGSAILG